MEMGIVSSIRSTNVTGDAVLLDHTNHHPPFAQRTPSEDAQDRPQRKLTAWMWMPDDSFVPKKTHIRYSLHRQLDEYFIQVIDNQTDEVIREIPPEKFLDMYAAIAKRIGLLVDEKI